MPDLHARRTALLLGLVGLVCAAPVLGQSAASSASLAESFREPPLTARPMALWPWLDGHVDREQLLVELREMHAKGLRGPIIWDIGSLADPEDVIPSGPEFLGEESRRSIELVCEEAARLGLQVGLVASSSWNAGGSWIGPELASKQLLWGERTVAGPSELVTELPTPEALRAPYTEVATFAVEDAAGGAEGSPAQVVAIDLSERVGDDGRLRWTVPEGEWRILRFVCGGTGQPLVCPSPNSRGLVVDHLNRAATDHHFGVMLDRLFGADGDRPPALTAMMLDSFEVWPRVDWTPGLEQRFEQQHGYDPRPWLPALANVPVGAPDLRMRFLRDYRAVVSAVMVENHFGRAAALLAARGLELIAEAGHGGYPRVNALEGLGAAHVPMGEFWNGKQFWVTKEAASAAHIYGRTDVAAESLTGWRHWRDGPAEYKRLFDIAFCAGLNRPVFHTFAHNPPSAGRPGRAYHAGEHFNLGSTWWQLSKPFLSYLSRCSHLLRQGQFVADVCFYYGDDSPAIVPSRRIDPKVTPQHAPDRCAHCGRPLPCRVDRLPAGHDYDYVNRDVLVSDMRVEDGALVLSSGMRYAMLVLPESEAIALPVLRRIEELVREGATVVGPRPSRSTGLAGYPECDAEVRQIAARMWGESGDRPRAHGRGRVLPPSALPGALFECGLRPDFTVEAPSDHQLDFIHRRTETHEIYFVANSADRGVDAECSFRVPDGYVPELWDPRDGSVTPCRVWRREGDSARVPIRLPAIGSVFVVFRRIGRPASVVAVTPVERTAPQLSSPGVAVIRSDRKAVDAELEVAGSYAIRDADGRETTVQVPDMPAPRSLAGPWRLRFRNGSRVGEQLQLPKLKSWSELESPSARFYSGTAVYFLEFDMPDGWLRRDLRVRLDLGEVREIAEVQLNGASLDVLWKPPYAADVTPFLRPGTNRMEVRVTNLWHNRIVGDLRLPELPPVAVTNLKNKFRADMELLPSGLIGPVRLVPSTVVRAFWR